MGQTTGRTLALLGLLQSGRAWSGPDLCARLGVSARTLRRDVDRLRALGYGVTAVPGVGGGYRLGAGASVPPLVLSNDEAMAIAVGLRVGATTALAGLEEAAAGALGKLERSLGSRTRQRLTTVRGALVAAAGGSSESVGVDVVEAVADAIRQERRMTVQYRRHDGTESRRQLEPHRLIHVEGRWYLVAWDLRPGDWRTLRLDRLQPRPPWGPRFTPRPVPDEQVRDLTSRSITTAPYPYWCRILARAPAAEVRSRFGPAVAQVEETGPDTATLTTGSTSLSELAGYLATGGFEFSVLDDGDGPALRAALTEVAQRLLRAAAPPAPGSRPTGKTDASEIARPH